MKEPIFLAIILFRCVTVRILEDDDEHENEDDDFSTSEFRLNQPSASVPRLSPLPVGPVEPRMRISGFLLVCWLFKRFDRQRSFSYV